MPLADIAKLTMVNTAAADGVALGGAQIISLNAQQPITIPSGQTGVPLLVGDRLQISCFGNLDNVAVTANVRYVNSQGAAQAVTLTWTYAAKYTPQQFFMDLPQPGYLQSVTLSWTPTIFGNVWMYASAGVVNSATGPVPYLTLVGDYLTTLGTATWPGRGLIHPLDHAGFSYAFIGDEPLAGDGWQQRVPTGVRWTVNFVSVVLKTSTAMGPRTLQLGVNWNKGGQWNSTLPVQVDASTTVFGQWDEYAQDFQNGVVVYRGPLPKPFYVLGCDILFGANDTFDAADQWQAPTIGITEHYQPDQTSCD